MLAAQAPTIKASLVHNGSRSQHRPRRATARRSHRLPVVATSEFWWEDEQEFDALTEVLLPKQVVLCTPSTAQQQVQQLQELKFVAAFSSPAVLQETEQLWQQLGRAGPPLFLKVRSRAALDTVDKATDPVIAQAAADQFWQEVASQSWRMDLDYGLSKDVTLSAATEQLLVVVGTHQGLQQLLSAASEPLSNSSGRSSSGDSSEATGGAAGSSSSSSSSTNSGGGGGSGVCTAAVVEFTGWNQGGAQQQLQSWRQLSPRVGEFLLDMSPASTA